MSKRRNSHLLSDTARLLSECNTVPLRYSVYDYSSYSGTYHPNNIYFNTPQNQSSRWSSENHTGDQYLILRLDQPTVARALLWGKFHRSHVCNVKEFKVYGGMDPNHMSELLFQVLQNHNKPELFKLRCSHQGLVIPVQYIKIVPLSTFSTNFNYSIWYLEIHGIDDPTLIQRVLDEYEMYKEKETIRLCMKHFRQRNMTDVFQLIKQQSGVELENPLLTRLHTAFVKNADFEMAESLMDQAEQQYEIFHSFTHQAKYTPIWKQLNPTPTPDGDIPCGRGGHQMCIDHATGLIYLHGGWTGKANLADFWSYSIKENRWHLISNNTSDQQGPSARSCHQMCLDSSSKSLFIFGRVVDTHASSTRNNGHPVQADFYRYYIESDHWEKLDDHTADSGGPELIFDHQMCVDPAAGKLYVFGGRTITGSSLHEYSGLYSYDIEQKTWRLIRNDLKETNDGRPPTPTSSSASSSTSASPVSAHHQPFCRTTLQSRVGHSMLLDPLRHQLYVFGGERADNYFYDLHQYDIETDSVQHIMPWQLQKHRKKKHHQQPPPSSINSFASPSSPFRTAMPSYSNGEHSPHRLNSYSSDSDGNDSDDDNYDIGTMGIEENDRRNSNGSMGSDWSNNTYYYYRGGNESGLSINSLGPDLGYTQRATLDLESRQVCIFSGYLRNMGCKTVKNVIRLYHLDRNTWEEVYTNERFHQSSSTPSCPPQPTPLRPQSQYSQFSLSNAYTSSYSGHLPAQGSRPSSKTESPIYSPPVTIDAATDYPTPRFSCQWVYDKSTKTHYLFGGDPHEYTDSDRRLGDLWNLKLIKPDVNSISQRCKYLIRAQKFKELCCRIEKDKEYDLISQALEYLQTQVTPLIDSHNDQEKSALSELCARLCLLGNETKTKQPDYLQMQGKPLWQRKMLHQSADSFYIDRTNVYTELLNYFPSDMKEPTGDVSDALRLL